MLLPRPTVSVTVVISEAAVTLTLTDISQLSLRCSFFLLTLTSLSVQFLGKDGGGGGRLSSSVPPSNTLSANEEEAEEQKEKEAPVTGAAALVDRLGVILIWSAAGLSFFALDPVNLRTWQKVVKEFDLKRWWGGGCRGECLGHSSSSSSSFPVPRLTLSGSWVFITVKSDFVWIQEISGQECFSVGCGKQKKCMHK